MLLCPDGLVRRVGSQVRDSTSGMVVTLTRLSLLLLSAILALTKLNVNLSVAFGVLHLVVLEGSLH